MYSSGDGKGGPGNVLPVTCSCFGRGALFGPGFERLKGGRGKQANINKLLFVLFYFVTLSELFGNSCHGLKKH